jgi:hypothetical protein
MLERRKIICGKDVRQEKAESIGGTSSYRHAKTLRESMGSMFGLLLLVACGPEPHRSPPVHVAFEALPVSGSLADARRAGFADCMERNPSSMRCSRHGVMFEGAGPYEAAVDLVGGDGSGGFDEITLWHDKDQDAVFEITKALDAKSWKSCNTGTDEKGDQAIYTRDGANVRISMDISYYGKRRLRIIPDWNKKEQRC